jgi:hypothetical protein
MTQRLVILALLLLLLVPRPAVAGESSTPPFRLVPADDLALSGLENSPSQESCPESTLSLIDERLTGCSQQPDADDAPAAAPVPGIEPPPQKLWPYRILPYATPIGLTAAGLATALTDSALRSFRFTNEGWFGRNTYAGGADKAAHFTNYAILSKEMIYLYQKLSYSERTSILLGSSMSFLEGLANEFGDGFNTYGFSPQDLTMDASGATIAALILATGTADLFNFRNGYLLPWSTATCCAVPGKGGDYSHKIYTADLKLAGVGSRLALNIGPLRYLLLSVTYGTKFYPSGLPDLRERQVGFEIGLNFEEILNALGAQRDTWWGYGLHVVFDNIRVPFTSVGFQYDMNHGKWYGPGNGNQYSTTP